MKRFIAALFGVMALARGVPAHAELGSSTGSNALALIQGADLIVVGRITDVDASGSARLSVVRTLKNSISTRGSELAVTRLANHPVPFVVGKQGIFFLRVTDGSITLAHPSGAVLPASLGVDVPSATDASVAVANELIQVLATPPGQLSGYSGSLSEVASLQNAEYFNYAVAVRALKTIPWAGARNTLRAVALSDVSNMNKRWAEIALLATGDNSLLDQTIAAVLDNTSPITDRMGNYIGRVLRSFPPPEGAGLDAMIVKVSPLLRVPDVWIRRGTASFLRDSTSKAAIRPLASAINDEDSEVRYFAISGLADLTGLQPVPSMDLFEESEAMYLTFWNSWKATNNY